MGISFLISSLAIGNLMSLKLQLCAPTILGIIIWLEKKKKMKSICSEEKVHSLTRTFNFNLGYVTECSNHYFLFFPPIFDNDIATITINFIPLFRQWYYHKPIANFFPLLFQQCHCHKSISQFFILFFRNDMCTQPTFVKNMAKYLILLHFYISLL